MTRYRIEYTEAKPGNTRVRQYDTLVGTLQSVRDAIDVASVWAADSIIVTEIIESDRPGRVVPASEWDV